MRLEAAEHEREVALRREMMRYEISLSHTHTFFSFYCNYLLIPPPPPPPPVTTIILCDFCLASISSSLSYLSMHTR